MASTDIERPNYFPRQFLGADDFIAEQSYQRDMRRRHNVGEHTWGIVVGLELVAGPPNQGLSDVFVQPGMAIDGYGREVIVLAPYQLDPNVFTFLNIETHVEIWIEFDALLAQRPVAGYAPCDPQPQFARVQETFRIVPAPAQPTDGDIIVAGNAVGPAPKPTIPPTPPPPLIIPDDRSVPYQELPDDANNPPWLIYLGWVNWNGTTGFAPSSKGNGPAADSDLSNRTYAGAIASNLLSPEATLRIRPRVTPLKVDEADFASVEGRLRVDGGLTAEADIYLAKLPNLTSPTNGKLQFQDRPPSPGITPFWLARQSPNELRIQLGDKLFAHTDSDIPQLTIGPCPAPGEKVSVSIGADQTVTIPDGVLSFGTTPRAMVKMGGATNANEIGTQTSTLYSRSEYGFAWYQKGSWVDGAGYDPGGGTTLMRLDPSGLVVDAPIAADQSLTLNAARTFVMGQDKAHDHWIMGGGVNEPENNALGFDLNAKNVAIGDKWTFSVGSNRIYFLGTDGGGYQWLMSGGRTEYSDNAIGFVPSQKQIIVAGNWDMTVGGNLNVEGTLTASGSQTSVELQSVDVIKTLTGYPNFVNQFSGTDTRTAVSLMTKPKSAKMLVFLHHASGNLAGSGWDLKVSDGTRDTTQLNKFTFTVTYSIPWDDFWGDILHTPMYTTANLHYSVLVIFWP